MQQKLDEHLNKIASHGFVEKVVNNSVIKSILTSSSFESVNKSVGPHMPTITTVLGVLAIISGILWALWILAMLWTLFGGLFAGSFFVIFLVSLIGVCFTLIEGYGLFAKKKRFPAVMIIAFAWGIISIIFQELFRGGIVGYRTGNYVLMLVISFIVLLFVLKNRDIFVK